MRNTIHRVPASVWVIVACVLPLALRLWNPTSWVPVGIYIGVLAACWVSAPQDVIAKPFVCLATGFAVSAIWATVSPTFHPAWILFFLLVFVNLYLSQNKLLTLAVVLSVTISFFSGDFGSKGRMLTFFVDVLRWDLTFAESAVIAIRKSIHFGTYGVLALSVWLAGRRFGSSRDNRVCAALLWTLSIACADEFSQTLTTTRTGNPFDVVLDMTGAIVVLSVAEFIARRKPNENHRS